MKKSKKKSLASDIIIANSSEESVSFEDSDIFGKDDFLFESVIENETSFFEDYSGLQESDKSSLKLKTLLKISTLMNQTYDISNLLFLVLDKIVEFSEAEKGCIILIKENDQLEFKAFKNYSNFEKGQIEQEISKTIIFDAISKQKAILINDAQNEDQYEDSESIFNLNLHSIICVPLIYKETALGVIYLDSSGINCFSREDLEILEIFSSQAATSIKNALLLQEINKHNEQLEEMVEKKSSQLLEVQKKIAKQEKLTGLTHMASGVAHYFNNMLAGIIGNAEILDMYESKHTKEIHEIINISVKMANFISNLLNFSRGKGEEKTLENIIDLIEDALIFKQFDLQNRGIKLIKNFKVNPKVVTSKFELIHTFINILANAIESFENIEKEDKQIEILVEKKDQSCLVTIRDNGRGIKKENLSSIFDPFFTTKGSISGGTHQGFGIGLSTAQRAISESKGDILVESELGKWTKVKIILPVKE